ncbi:MAG: sulfurtransferase [Granulosicoccus sp.]
MAFPLVLDGAELASLLGELSKQDRSLADEGICLIDLQSAEQYESGHLPGAVHGNATMLNATAPPVGGLLPDEQTVNRFLSDAGAQRGDQILVYDRGMQTPAARLIWVLHAYGYEACSWLNGGFETWSRSGYPVTCDVPLPPTGNLVLHRKAANVLSVDDLLALIQKEPPAILDVRSRKEYEGTDVRSAYGGHVPDAAHLEWTSMLDQDGLLLGNDELLALLQPLIGAAEDTTIVYCQTHQRSAVTYVALKHLGYTDVRAIDGAWSNWGNREDTPKITEPSA